jgi:clan AA aspartic protease
VLLATQPPLRLEQPRKRERPEATLSEWATGRYNRHVGTFQVQIEVGNPTRRRFVAVDALVDTGSTYTVLPRPLLEELGVVPHRRGEFELADGTRVERDLGRAWIRFEGREEYTLVVFGEDALLGAVTLEELNRVVDPIRQRLVRVPALMKRLAA